jgi:carbon-monoxide dehydrogenase large subunit
MGEFGIGQPVRRFEDKRFLSGNGRFQNDSNLLGQAYAYVLRSPHAHARIRALDLTTAKAAPGVVLIMTGDDLVEAKLGVMGVPFERKRPERLADVRSCLSRPRAAHGALCRRTGRLRGGRDAGAG